MRKNSASGCDGISVKFLHHFTDILVLKLTELVNVCLRTGFFPQCLKTAKVKCIYKAGDKNRTTNYRPISVLSNISKIFEKSILQQLEYYIEQNNLIHPNQFGFIRKSNTTSATTSLHFILNFILSRKAFDCVKLEKREKHSIVSTTPFFSKSSSQWG